MSLRGEFFAVTYDRQMQDREGRAPALRSNCSRHEAVTCWRSAAGPAQTCPSTARRQVPDHHRARSADVRRLERRAASSARTQGAARPAEDLPFDDDTFDVVGVDPGALRRRATSPGRCASCDGCSGPAVSCCSSSTFAPTTPSSPHARTA